jgi:PAS domain S-box-containing protein
MGRTFDKGVLVGVGLVVALLVVNAGLGYWNTRQLHDDAGWVAHTHEVLDQTRDVLRTLVDAETGQRGFLVTSKETFLEPYHQALARLDQRVQALKDLTQDNPRQQARIEKLKKLTAEQLALLEQGIDLHRNSAQQARALVASGAGKAKMDAIRQLIATIEDEEHDLLQERQQQSGLAYHTAVWTELVAAAIGLGLVGALVYLLGRTLHERSLAAALLHEQRERLRVTLASIGDAVISTDTAGRVTFLSPVAESLTGWSQQQARGQPLEAVFPILQEQTRQPVENPVARVLREGVIVGLGNHTVLVARDGSEWPIDDSAAPIRGAGGETVGVVLVFRDISERKRAERAGRFLADASKSLAALVDHGSTMQKVARLAVPAFADWSAVDIVEPDGSVRRAAVVHADSAKIDLVHELTRRYPPDSTAPVGLANVLRTGQSEMLPDIPDAMLTAAAQDQEHLRILRELGLRSYMCVPLAVRGTTVGAVTFATAESGRRFDATDLAVAEDLAHRAGIAMENARLYSEAREADRRKDEFLAMLAHELRNPLAPIRNSLHILKQPGAEGSVGPRAREMMERQVQHMSRMVEDLLDVSRITRGKIELRTEAVDLAAVVSRPVEATRPLRGSPAAADGGSPAPAGAPGSGPDPPGADPGEPAQQRRQVH